MVSSEGTRRNREKPCEDCRAAGEVFTPFHRPEIISQGRQVGRHYVMLTYPIVRDFGPDAMNPFLSHLNRSTYNLALAVTPFGTGTNS